MINQSNCGRRATGECRTRENSGMAILTESKDVEPGSKAEEVETKEHLVHIFFLSR